MRAGQTFLYPIGSQSTPHLWIVATDPDPEENVVIVSLTSLRGGKDQTVIIQAGEHPFVRWQTCVYYRESIITTVQKIAERVDCGEAEMKTDISPKLLSEIFDGFTASNFTSHRVRRFVESIRRGKSAGH